MKHDKPTEDAVSVTEERRQFDLPELLHNLDLLVEMAESEVIQNDKKWVLLLYLNFITTDTRGTWH